MIHIRIHRKLETDIIDAQFGFRDELGTRAALFALNVMSQICVDINQNIFVSLTRVRAFDQVNRIDPR